MRTIANPFTRSVPLGRAMAGACAPAVIAAWLLSAAGGVFAAPSYVVVGGELTRILDVDVGGVLYDVEFKDGTFATALGGVFDFAAQADAVVAASALDGAIADTAAGSFDSVPGLTFGCETINDCGMLTPYQFDALGRVVSALLINTNASDTIANADARLQTFDTTAALNFVWADWTRSTVNSVLPEPSSFALLISGALAGLLLLWFRRRVAHHGSLLHRDSFNSDVGSPRARRHHKNVH